MTKSGINSYSNNISRWQTPHLSDKDGNQDEPKLTEDELRSEIYEESYIKGYQAGLNKGQEKIQQQLELLNNFISNLSSPFNEMNQQISEELARLAGKIARKLVKRELKTEPETIMAIVRDSLKALNEGSDNISVHLSPEDAQVVEDILKRVSKKQRWNIVEDPFLSKGDCKIASRDSLVDENLQSRINLIINQFLGDDRIESNNE